MTVDESAFSGSGALSPLSPASVAALAPGASATFTATYTLTQSDVDSGSVTNTAIATGVPPGGGTPTSPPSTVEIPVIPAPALTISKTADLTEIVAAGQEITYSFLVTNTGNVTITDARVDETAFSGSGMMSPTSPALVASLLPGASATFTATYVVTQADVDTTQLSNTAVAIGTSPGGPPTSPPSSVVVPVVPAPSLDVVKSASPSDAASFVAGQEIEYSFVVTNTGNLTLTDVTVDETAFTGTGPRAPVVPATAPQLAPGESATFLMLYTLTQADVDAGSVTNTATATGVPPHGGTPTSPPSTVTIPVDPAPALSLVKSADVTELVAAGQEITYSFLATNTGNVTITNVTIDETAFSGSGTLSALTPASAASLLPGETATFTATYVVTQEDVDSGELTNTATTTGDTPGGGIPVSPPSTVSTPTAPAPSLALVKTADHESVVGVDQLVTYTFSVKNTGNLTLSDVRIDETVFSGTGQLSAVTCAAGSDILAPGESTECTASYRTTAADVAAGRLHNEAVASGIPSIQSPGGRTTSSPSSVRVAIAAPPGGLATTGVDVTSTLLPALSLLIVGAGVLLFARRMRTPFTTAR